MKRIFIFLFFIFLTSFNFFGNEKAEIISPDNVLSFNYQSSVQKDIVNIDSGYISEEANILHNKVNYASKKIPARFNQALGVGFMVSGQLLFWLFGLGLIAGGVVLMAVHDSSYTWSDGSYASWVSPDKYNAGLACVIIGGICFLTGIAFIIAGGVNFGIAAKKNNRRRSELFKNIFLIADYNMKEEEFILGARFLL